MTDASGGGIRGGGLTLIDSTISGNSTFGDFANGGGIYTLGDAVALIGSTVSGNAANYGGGVANAAGTLSLTNSTISGNRATESGGGIWSLALPGDGLTLTNTTVTGNQAKSGGGISERSNINYSTITNSIIAGNFASEAHPDFQNIFFESAPTTINHSLIGVADDVFIAGNVGNQLGTIDNPLDPLLGPLADNGGPTLTHALPRDSSAVDAGDSDFIANGPDGIAGTEDDVQFDQRGTGFARVVGGGVDLGAFERQPPTSTFVPDDVTVVFETLSNLDLSAVEIAEGNGNEVMVTPTVDTGTFDSPVDGEGVTADLISPQTITLVGTPLDVTLYFDDESNIQYTPVEGLFGEGAATLTLAVGSAAAGVADINVAEVPSLIVSTVADVLDRFDRVTSLREAIGFANSPARPGLDTIVFDGLAFASGDSGLIRLIEGELEITESLNIDGSTVGGVTITGDANGDDIVDAENITDVEASFIGVSGGPTDLLDDNSRVLLISGENVNSTLRDLVITGGRTTDRLDRGGGIRASSSGQLSLVNTLISGNSVAGYFSSGGGISAVNATLTESTVSNNFAARRGGGVSAGSLILINSSVVGNVAELEGSQGGGGGISSVDVTLINSVVSGNRAGARGGGINAAGIGTSAVTLHNSIVSGNSTSGNEAHGGAIYTLGRAVTLTNSTVSRNQTLGVDSDGGGIFTYSGLVTLRNSTVTTNEASGSGGGIFGDEIGFKSNFLIENSIVAGNRDSGSAPDLSPDPIGILTINYSLIGVGDNLGSISGNVDNQIGTVGSPIDPLLGPLADNGGPTFTHALLPGSPAIDAGDPVFDVNGPDGIVGTGDDVLFDQRGTGFDRVVSGRVDIGAFEFQPNPSDPPSILLTKIDEGGVLARPDQWQTLTVTFDRDVAISTDALSLTNDTHGGTAVDLSQALFDYNSTTYTATWTFDASNRLPFAFYTYTLDASLITAGGLQLDGNGDGTGGDNVVAEHYVALPGDANLDGKVDVLGDGFLLVDKLGKVGGSVWADGDFNGDGDVNVLGDGFIFVIALGESVIPPVAASLGRVVSPGESSVGASSLPLTVIVEAEDNLDEEEDDLFGSKKHELEPTVSPQLAAHQSLDLTFESEFPSDLFFGF